MRINSFIPNWTNQQFINMLAKRYNVNKSKFNKMKRKQLIAIYCNSYEIKNLYHTWKD